MTIFPTPPDMKTVGASLVVSRILNMGNRNGYPYNLWSFSCDGRFHAILNMGNRNGYPYNLWSFSCDGRFHAIEEGFAKYGDGEYILPHTDGHSHYTNHTIEGRH